MAQQKCIMTVLNSAITTREEKLHTALSSKSPMRLVQQHFFIFNVRCDCDLAEE
jgi:hypothetical protein